MVRVVVTVVAIGNTFSAVKVIVDIERPIDEIATVREMTYAILIDVVIQERSVEIRVMLAV